MTWGWPRYYILVDRVPFAVDLETWGVFFENNDNRRLAQTVINEKTRVSTIFLGLDHNFYANGEPVLFETMIFGGPLDGQQWRYTTYADAERGHDEAVTQARKAAAQINAIAEEALKC